MSAPEAVTEEELLAVKMYRAALQIDADPAAEEFFRMSVDQREFWLRAARRALAYFRNVYDPQWARIAVERLGHIFPPSISISRLEELKREHDAELRQQFEKLERLIINLLKGEVT